MAFEGGFQGRANKLVDSCYSFWQGSIFPLLNGVKFDEISRNNKDYYLSFAKVGDLQSGKKTEGDWLFNEINLQDYIITCCQSKSGGLQDKPGKSCDYYHTCYALSGLSIAQHSTTLIVHPASSYVLVISS
jgi:prenyltransferase beta subunit